MPFDFNYDLELYSQFNVHGYLCPCWELIKFPKKAGRQNSPTPTRSLPPSVSSSTTTTSMAFQFTPVPPANDTPFARPNTVVAVVRKRGRCDSDPQGRPEKMYKGYDDANTDTEMEGLMSASSSTTSSASSACALLVSELDNQSSWKQDEEFYMEDGSCVLLVEDILFNVGVTIAHS